MQFSWFGGRIQFQEGSEGNVLRHVGLLDVIETDTSVEVEATTGLRMMFDRMPPLEELYPVLVEFVISYRYEDNSRFIDRRDVQRKLLRLGMNANGLENLGYLMFESSV